MSHPDLDSPLNAAIDYTRRDEITFSLMDTIKCPISLDYSENMVLFNHQFYDRTNFDSHRSSETRLNERRIRLGQISRDGARLKDPRTGEDYNSTYALRCLYNANPTRAIIKDVVRNRIPHMTEEDVNAFVPEEDDCTMNITNFVNQIRTMANSREPNRFAYDTHISQLQNAAAAQRILRTPPPPPPPLSPPTTPPL